MGIAGFFLEPKIVFIVFALFLIGYLIFLDEEGAFRNGFLQFGPGQGTFIGIKLDSWLKVVALYTLGFVTSLMTSYYQWVMSNNIHSYVYSRGITEVPYGSFWVYTVMMIEPLFYQILQIIQFFTTLTMQLQFIIPQFLGSLVANIPFMLMRLSEKTYPRMF